MFIEPNNENIDEIVKVDDSVLKSYGSGIYISIGEKICFQEFQSLLIKIKGK